MKRIFIVGCPRSGTTLLQSLLLKHEDIISFPESHFFPLLFLSPKGQKYPVLYGNYIFLRWKLKIKKENNINLKYKFGLNKNQVISNFIKSLDEYALNNNKSAWIEKTPSNLYVIDKIEEFIEEPIFIHIIRNGLDVVASLYEATNKYTKYWKKAYSIDDVVERYKKDVRISLKYKDKSNHFFIKYEDLLYDNKIILYLLESLQFDLSKFSFERDVSNQIISKEEKWKELNKTNKIIDTTNKKFKMIFTLEEQKYIINRLKDFNVEI